MASCRWCQGHQAVPEHEPGVQVGASVRFELLDRVPHAIALLEEGGLEQHPGLVRVGHDRHAVHVDGAFR